LDDAIELMVEYLVCLQFYDDEDESLYSRDKKIKIKIPGIRPIIKSFIDDFLSCIDLVSHKAYRDYLERLVPKLGFDITNVWTEFNNNINELPQNELTPELVVNFLIGPIRSNLQNSAFSQLMTHVKAMALARLPDSSHAASIDSKIGDAFSRNDDSVSILYNLGFLRFLVIKYGDDILLDSVNELVSNYSMKLVTRLIP